MEPKILAKLDDVLSRYDALFCDVWGVVHNGRAAYAPACAALARARRAGKIVLLVSNVPKPRDPIPGQLNRLGAPRDAWDAVITSGDAIRAELKRRAPGPMYKIGPDHDAVLWEGLGLMRAELNSAAFLGVSGLNDDTRETPEDYRDILAAARARNLDLICANPDIVVQRGDQLVWCAGALARDYEEIGGRVIMAGKPHAAIYEEAYRELAARVGRPVDKGRILAIGDGVPTDVRGANREGIDCLFIASGMHGEKLKTNGVLDLGKVEAALSAETVHARYVMAALE
jgi:HAD superfamily hydrolase (TIGR01459 family)